MRGFETKNRANSVRRVDTGSGTVWEGIGDHRPFAPRKRQPNSAQSGIRSDSQRRKRVQCRQLRHNSVVEDANSPKPRATIPSVASQRHTNSSSVAKLDNWQVRLALEGTDLDNEVAATTDRNLRSSTRRANRIAVGGRIAIVRGHRIELVQNNREVRIAVANRGPGRRTSYDAAGLLSSHRRTGGSGRRKRGAMLRRAGRRGQ